MSLVSQGLIVSVESRSEKERTILTKGLLYMIFILDIMRTSIRCKNRLFQAQIYSDKKAILIRDKSFRKKSKRAEFNDIGEMDNIHPENMQDVGKRLLLPAKKEAYSEDLVFTACNVLNMEELPVSPFRIDSWREKT